MIIWNLVKGGFNTGSKGGVKFRFVELCKFPPNQSRPIFLKGVVKHRFERGDFNTGSPIKGEV